MAKIYTVVSITASDLLPVLILVFKALSRVLHKFTTYYSTQYIKYTLQNLHHKHVTQHGFLWPYSNAALHTLILFSHLAYINRYP